MPDSQGSSATPFTSLVGCDLPIQQAPIGLPAATPELPAAVAEAGGHGMLAAVTVATADLSAKLDLLNARTSAYGVNFSRRCSTRRRSR